MAYYRAPIDPSSSPSPLPAPPVQVDVHARIINWSRPQGVEFTSDDRGSLVVVAKSAFDFQAKWNLCGLTAMTAFAIGIAISFMINEHRFDLFPLIFFGLFLAPQWYWINRSYVACTRLTLDGANLTIDETAGTPATLTISCTHLAGVAEHFRDGRLCNVITDSTGTECAVFGKNLHFLHLGFLRDVVQEQILAYNPKAERPHRSLA